MPLFLLLLLLVLLVLVLVLVLLLRRYRLDEYICFSTPIGEPAAPAVYGGTTTPLHDSSVFRYKTFFAVCLHHPAGTRTVSTYDQLGRSPSEESICLSSPPFTAKKKVTTHVKSR